MTTLFLVWPGALIATSTYYWSNPAHNHFFVNMSKKNFRFLHIIALMVPCSGFQASQPLMAHEIWQMKQASRKEVTGKTIFCIMCSTVKQVFEKSWTHRRCTTSSKLDGWGQREPWTSKTPRKRWKSGSFRAKSTGREVWWEMDDFL